jgi:hypothetical protein
MDIRVSVTQEPNGRWTARSESDPGLRGSGATRERCLVSLRRALDRSTAGARRRGEPVVLVVESLPRLAGVAEAAEVMGWDKRRVITYIDRGRFPEPVQTLASGRVWRREDVERYAAEWQARQRVRRRRPGPRPR